MIKWALGQPPQLRQPSKGGEFPKMIGFVYDECITNYIPENKVNKVGYDGRHTAIKVETKEK
ncbi:MAG: hypothetical protein WCP85_09170 [Mariniphaga sp.]